jgi:prepilin-type N-terminal cleavage/methylation domain-containing protein
MSFGSGPFVIGGRARARGFTLIELLLTLVVLLIGIYGMLRIFPRGFMAIEVGQQRTIAAGLAEAEIARWKLHPESLPDAVIATDLEGNLIQATIVNNEDSLSSVLVHGGTTAFMPGSMTYESLQLPFGEVGIDNLDFYAKALIYSPLDLTPSQFDAAQAVMPPGASARPNTAHPNWQPNSLYLPRTVIGERIDIRRLGRTILGVPFYLLSHAPLAPLRLEDNPLTPEEDRSLEVYVDIYDAQAWMYVPYGAGELNQREFTLDPATGALFFGPTDFPPAEPRRFKVDYTDPVTFQRLLGLTVIVGPGATQGAPPLPLGVAPDTIMVHERLQQVDNPNLLRITDPGDPATRRNIFYVNPETTISGRIEFPLMLQIDPRPTDISLVKVDYRVYDWSILAFDVEVPPGGIVRLPVGRIKGPSFTNPPRQPRPQEVARGIKREYDWSGDPQPVDPRNPVSWAHIVAVDRQSGEILTDHEGAEWPANAYERRSRFLVNYRDGLLDFNYDHWDVYQFNPEIDTPDRSGRTYRIFCRAEDDWAVQLMVTARRYGRSGTGIPGGQPAGGEGGGSDVLLTYAWNPEVDARQVYFPLSEYGQAVAIDYYYLDPNTGNLTFVEGEVHAIGEADVTDLGQWVCRLARPLEHEPYYSFGPVGVRGIGVRARTTWVGPGRATTLQDLVSALTQSPPGRAVPSLGETWHQVIVDTYLTRAPI